MHMPTETPRLTTIFSQRVIHLDGKPSGRSDWGAVSVTYPRFGGIAYLNIAIDERWIIRNAPMFPPLVAQSVECLFYFDLGVKPGTSVNNLNVATSLSLATLAQAPTAYARVPVKQISEIYWTNFINEPFPPLGAPPPGYIGGRIDQPFYCRLNYPNQPCGKNECGPTAVSNSLQWLNKEYGLNIDPKKLTINYWNAALGNTGNGVEHGAWADTKKKYVDDKNNGLPIDSTKESGGHAAQVLKEFNGEGQSKKAQAVEMDAGGHVASVVCIGGPDADTRNYHLMCASDTAQQGQQGPGNPQVQQVEITPDGVFVNAVPPCWAKGDKVQNFVVQCPHPGKFP